MLLVALRDMINQFPTLARIATQVLAAEATSGETEGVSSTAGILKPF